MQARPAIVRLDLGFANNLDNEDLRIICEGLRLEHLDLSFNDSSLAADHPSAIEVIVESPCAQTLRSINLCQLPFIPEELLQLLRGCPKLAKLEWEAPEEDEYFSLFPIEDGPAVDAINALLKSRGGRASRWTSADASPALPNASPQTSPRLRMAFSIGPHSTLPTELYFTSIQITPRLLVSLPSLALSKTRSSGACFTRGKQLISL